MRPTKIINEIIFPFRNGEDFAAERIIFQRDLALGLSAPGKSALCMAFLVFESVGGAKVMAHCWQFTQGGYKIEILNQQEKPVLVLSGDSDFVTGDAT
jgi:hypothetical protein